MKQFSPLLILLFIVNIGFSQDIIIKKNGDKIESKIVAVYENELHYKKFSNLDGPIYIIPATSLQEIKYENGEVERYTETNNSTENFQQKTTTLNTEEITVRAELFYYNGRQISTKKVKQLFVQHNANEAIETWHKAQFNYGVSFAANILSYPVVLVSYFNPFGVFLDPTTRAIISIGGYLASAGLQITSYWQKAVYKDKRLEAIEQYNDIVTEENEHSGDDYY